MIDETKLEEMTPFEYLVNKRVDSVPVKKHIVKLNKNVSYFNQQISSSPVSLNLNEIFDQAQNINLCQTK